MARIKDLENAPNWLKNATVSDEDVEIIDGVVHWKSGHWYWGEWKDGIFYSEGIFHSGLWWDGHFHGWWNHGTWFNGTFHNDAIWFSGYFIDGFREDGNRFNTICSPFALHYNKDVVIGLSNSGGTFEYYDNIFKNNLPLEFYSGNESYEPETFKYKQAKAHFYALKAYKEVFDA